MHSEAKQGSHGAQIINEGNHRKEELLARSSTAALWGLFELMSSNVIAPRIVRMMAIHPPRTVGTEWEERALGLSTTPKCRSAR